jgi:5-(aminomethyl)-3-furanmethanol phosphate kinase
MIESVFKVGGKLIRGNRLRKLCLHLEKIGCRRRILLVPGGGPFADTVRAQDTRYGLSDGAAHWMAILAMDQYGHFLADLIPRSKLVRTIVEAKKIAGSGRVPVLLPFEMMYCKDPLPQRWSVTSDSISAWVAKIAQAPMLVLLKDVDGLYSVNSGKEGGGKMLEDIRLDQLSASKGVDPYFAKIMKTIPLKLWVINGQEPERAGELMSKGWTRGTRLLR